MKVLTYESPSLWMSKSACLIMHQPLEISCLASMDSNTLCDLTKHTRTSKLKGREQSAFQGDLIAHHIINNPVQ